MTIDILKKNYKYTNVLLDVQNVCQLYSDSNCFDLIGVFINILTCTYMTIIFPFIKLFSISLIV